MLTRRRLLAASSMAAATAGLAGAAWAQDPPGDAWAEVPAILARIRPPIIPSRAFPITAFGAVGNGVADCTVAFRNAIGACHAAGGGRVLVPEGAFLSGAIHLKSNVELHLQRGAVIRFSTDPRAYLPLVPTRWEGVELMNYSPFIYAFGQENVALTGEGMIDGQSDDRHWWPWKGKTEFGWRPGQPNQDAARRRLFAMAEQGVPVNERVFGEGAYLRPQFVQFYRCRNVLLQGVTLKGSPMWQVHPVLCTNVIARRLTISAAGPNTDGCDPESCRDVLIEDCRFSTGDDCIAIKSGRNADGRRLHLPTENVVVRRCHMADGHGALTVGSEISGGVRNVFGEDCRMDSPELDYALRFKNNAMRGGVLENLNFRNISVGQVAHAVIQGDFNYEEGAAGPFKPVLRDVTVSRLTSRKSQHALDLQGLPNAPISDVRITDCDFEGVASGNLIRNVEGLELRRVLINGRPVSGMPQS